MNKSLLAGALPALGALVLAAPAVASPPTNYTVSVGGSSTPGTHAFTATSGPTRFVVNGTTMTCASTSVSGVIHSGTAVQPIADITSSTWNTCRDAFGTPLTVVQVGTWHLNGNDINVHAGLVDGHIVGTISGINAHVYDTSMSGLCDFNVGGVADGWFNETSSPQAVHVNENGADSSLKVTSLASTSSDCLGAVSPGAPTQFYGDYTINVPHGAVDVAP
ncbi:hypothetical protein GCM10022237_21580 [Nocardioides ginsengisoli]|uniref:Secreted protein n=1 Tax=Nocardioides ginsengisoli TaxID=363868 RepID=A0ABW3W0U2_9ACTN